MRGTGAGPGERLRAEVARSVERARRRATAAVAVTVMALAPAGLLVAWAVGPWPFRAGPVALIAAGAVTAVAVAVALGRRWVLAVDEDAVAGAAEVEQGLPEGSVRGVLELGRGLPPGTSPGLYRRTAQELEGRLPHPVAGELLRRTRRRGARALLLLAALTGAAAVVGLATPDRARAAWTPLLRPVAHLEAPVLPPLRVSPGDTAVSRGGSLDVEVRAPGRQHVRVHWRAVGDVPDRRLVAVSGSTAVTTLGPIRAPTDYWAVGPDGATTDTFRVVPRDPLLVTTLTVDVVYPSHTGVAPDRYRNDVPPLRVPEGTRLRLQGRTTRPAVAVSLVRDGAERSATVAGPSFAMDWTPGPADGGVWQWRLQSDDTTGGGLPPLVLDVTADEPPAVRVTVPGVDTVMPSSRRQPVIADAVDDWGVASGTLVFRAAGAGDSTVAPMAGGSGPRALLRGVLDASELGLTAGDVVEYYVAATDNGPDARTGRSAVHTLRLPDMAALRDRARAEAAGAVDAARRVAAGSRSVESAARDLSRRTAGAGPRGPRGGARSGREASSASESRSLGYEEAAEARQLAEEYEAVVDAVQELRHQLAELEQTATAAGLRDPELQARLEELAELYARLDSPEVRDALDRLRAAAERLDPDAVRRALEELAERQTELRRVVEASLAALRRAVAAQEMNALARDAEELAARQAALTASLEESAGAIEDGARREEALAGRTGTLAAALDSLGRTLEVLNERSAAAATDEAGREADGAQRAMAAAAGATRGGRIAESVREGETAAEALRSAAARLDSARAELTRSRAAAALAAVRQATGDALALADREETVRRELEEARARGGLAAEELQAVRSVQAAVQQGLDRLARNLAEAGLPLLDPQVATALDRARTDGESTARGLAEPGPTVPASQAAAAVESLNQLAVALLENAGRSGQSGQSGQASGGVQQALHRLAELAGEQGALNGQVGAVASLEASGEGLGRQLRELARRQRDLARRLDEVAEALAGRRDVPGRVDALADEARQIAADLEAGRLDPEVRARQERLFRRLLDAGRSLERDEYSHERVGRRPEPGQATAATPAATGLETGLRYPVPSADRLRALPPAFRTLVLEYFDRLNRGAVELEPGGEAGAETGVGAGTESGTEPGAGEGTGPEDGTESQGPGGGGR